MCGHLEFTLWQFITEMTIIRMMITNVKRKAGVH